MTVKQHSVPRMIMKRHAAVIVPPKKKNKNPKYYLYLHNKKTKENNLVDIYDIGYEKYLYELRDESGNILEGSENQIEKIFACLEGKWSPILDKVKRDEQLTEEDEGLLYALIALQILRTPQMLETVQIFLKEVRPTLTDAEAERYARISGLVAGKITEEVNFILNMTLEIILKRNLVVYHSNIPFIFDKDCLIFGESITGEKEHINMYFPFDKYTCIGLMVGIPKNNIMILPDNYVKWLNSIVYNNAEKYVCSSTKL